MGVQHGPGPPHVGCYNSRLGDTFSFRGDVKYCDLTLPTAEENLACDEALLELCESGGVDGVLRFWECGQYFVVLGYGNRVATEVNRGFCQQFGIPVLRRCTGGGTVLQGPGCLNYSLVLSCNGPEELQTIPGTNEFVLQRHQQALTALLGAKVERRGQTDLTIGGLKFSGNSQRRRQKALLFHGSFLLHLDIDLLTKALPLPSRRPEYRADRSHGDFLMNLKVPPHLIKAALLKTWGANEPLKQVPYDQMNSLVIEKYGRDDWNLKF